MSELKPHYKLMSLDAAIARKRDEKAEQAYLEFFQIYMNTETRP